MSEISGISIGKGLQAVRKQRGLSQGELAELMRCNRTYISKVENDGSVPSLESLHRFAVALKTTPWALLKFIYSAGKVEQPSKEVKRISAKELITQVIGESNVISS